MRLVDNSDSSNWTIQFRLSPPFPVRRAFFEVSLSLFLTFLFFTIANCNVMLQQPKKRPSKMSLSTGVKTAARFVVLLAPAVFQSTTPAASKRTPARPAITKVTATKNSATVTWNFQLFYITSFIFPTSSFSACLSTDWKTAPITADYWHCLFLTFLTCNRGCCQTVASRILRTQRALFQAILGFRHNVQYLCLSFGNPVEFDCIIFR